MLTIDIQIKGIGRIKKSAGTDDTKTRDAIKTMLLGFKTNGRWNLLQQVKDGIVSPMQLYSMHTTGQLQKNVSASTLLPFPATAVKWIAGYTDVKPRTQNEYRLMYLTLAKYGTAKATVADVPVMLNTMRKAYAKKDAARYFNMTRNAVRSYLGNTQGRFTDTYIQVTEVKPLREVNAPKGRARRIHEVYALKAVLKPEAFNTIWTMAVTGAGLAEFRNGLSIQGAGVQIMGTKMDHKDGRRRRVVPHTNEAILLLPHLQVKALRMQLKPHDMQVYDMRRTFALMCQEAGIPRHRIEMYMGHVPKSVTDGYLEAEMHAFLVEDGKRLTTYIANHSQPIKINTVVDKFFG